ncbi:MAG TPA: hypothetical protein VK454_08855 [Myxococcaceae bacterium]|nr:hypothetical protein [Myxococcaceae bacterium]
MRAPAAALLGSMALVGCGTASPADLPTLQLPFTSSASAPVSINGVQGVQVGAQGTFIFQLLNAGNQALVVQSISYQGDPEIGLDAAPLNPLPATVDFNHWLSVAVTCSPLAAQTYSGTVTIVSNAANAPTALVYLDCVGTL